MSEPRAAYNVAMRPGRELDALVARVMHRANVVNHPDRAIYSEAIESARDIPPAYSTVIAVAMGAWAWLEENNPWKRPDTIAFSLTRDDDGRPSVLHIYGYDEYATIATGTTYPHAISLAICEAGKALGVIE